MLETLSSGQGLYEGFDTMEIPGLDDLPASVIPVVKNIIAATLDNPAGSNREIEEIYDGRMDGYYYRSCSVLDALSFFTLGFLATKRMWMDRMRIDGGEVIESTEENHGLMVTDSSTADMALKSIRVHTRDISGGNETGKFDRILGLHREQVPLLLQQILLQPVLLEFQLLPGQKPSRIYYSSQTQIPPMIAANVTARCRESLQKHKGFTLP